MTRYLIKETYLEGIHKGKTYLLRKGGWLTTEDSIYEDEETTYKTKAIVERVCRNMTEKNNAEREFERIMEKRRVAEGKQPKEVFLYNYMKYEPYAVEI